MDKKDFGSKLIDRLHLMSKGQKKSHAAIKEQYEIRYGDERGAILETY